MLISDMARSHGTLCGPELDFLYDLQDTLTKVPLILQDIQAASTVIRILGSQLLYSTTTTGLTRDQGFYLCRVLWATLKLRELTTDEMDIIYSLATRRLER